MNKIHSPKRGELSTIFGFLETLGCADETGKIRDKIYDQRYIDYFTTCYNIITKVMRVNKIYLKCRDIKFITLNRKTYLEYTSVINSKDEIMVLKSLNHNFPRSGLIIKNGRLRDNIKTITILIPQVKRYIIEKDKQPKN